jgi:hypothetical protein
MTTHHRVPRVASSVVLASRPTRNRRTLRFLVGLAAGIALMATSQTPASAHGTTVWHERDNASAWEGHNGFSVQDRECDGHRVRAQAKINTIGGVVRDNLYDPDGCGPNHGARDWHPQRVTHIRVCEVSVGCSAWLRVQ